MAKHGVYVIKQESSVSTPNVADVSVPFVIGCAPVQTAVNPAAPNIPVLCTSWDEFVEQFGYSKDWKTYNLCEFAYSHFKLYGCQPVIFCNLLDMGSMKADVSPADMDIIDGCVNIPTEAVVSSIVVEPAGGEGKEYVLDTDYTVIVKEDRVTIELIGHKEEKSVNVGFAFMLTDSVNASYVASKMDCVDLCMVTAGKIPDLIVAPGYSNDPAVAAIMATKAAAINGLFEGKALIDIDCSADGCTVYNDVSAYKNEKNLVDDAMILCWPMMKLGDMTFHMSTQLAGLMASVDVEHGNPYESPSNKNFQMDTICLADGSVVFQSKAQADTLNTYGVVTALNFLSSGWVCWGNYTACYPGNADAQDCFIPVSRMFGWVGNTLIQTFWKKLDKPMNRRLLDTIVDSCNIWLNGLVGSGYLLGARAEVLEAENPDADLMAGIIKIHIYLTPPSPAQEIDFILEYDASYVSSALL